MGPASGPATDFSARPRRHGGTAAGTACLRRWHCTLAPLALGVSTGTFSGRFDAARLLRALHDFGITTMSAAATHCGMMRNSGQVDAFAYALDKLSFTRELIDSKTAAYIEAHFGAKAGSMHVAAEIGVIIANYPGANYPGADDLDVRDRALGKAVPGAEVEVQDANGAPRRARTGRRAVGQKARRMGRDQRPRARG
jgi:acetyl-CoA synthetase